MIPVLYERDENQFVTNGLGALAEAITCVVTEERNGSFELKMTYPASGAMFHEIVNDRIILAKPAQGRETEPFRIYKIGKPINGIVTINAEHISYQLSYVPVSPFSVKSVTVDKVFEEVVAHQEETHPFTFWTDNDRTSNFTLPNPMVIRETLGGWEGSIIDMFRGEYEFNRYTVKLWKNRGSNKGFEIRYGKNLTDLNQEENIGNVVTSIYPFYYYDDGETQTLVTLPEKILDSEYTDRYQYRRTVCHDFTERFQQTPTVEELRAVALQYLGYDYIGIPSVNITVKFAQLEQSGEFETLAMLEEVGLCDTVNIIFEQLDIRTTAKVTKAVYDVLMERFDSLTFGDVRTGLVKTFTETDKRLTTMINNIVNVFPKIIGTQNTAIKELLEQKIIDNTALITGATGGNIVMKFDETTGLPYEEIYMDTDSEVTAKDVVVQNSRGILIGNNGVNGPFRVAISANGINADEITTGNLIANIIKSGVLSSLNNKFYLDMETGAVNLASANITGGRILIETNDDDRDKIRLSMTKDGYNYFSEINSHEVYIQNGDNHYTTYLQGGGVYTLKTGDSSEARRRISLIAGKDGENLSSYLNLYSGNGTISSELGRTLKLYDESGTLAVQIQRFLLANYRDNGSRIFQIDNQGIGFYRDNGSELGANFAYLGTTGIGLRTDAGVNTVKIPRDGSGISFYDNSGHLTASYGPNDNHPEFYSDYNSDGAHDGAIPELGLTSSNGLTAYLNKLKTLKTGTKISVWLNGSSAIGQEVRGSLNPILGGDNYGELVMEKIREDNIWLTFRNYDNAHFAQATYSTVNNVGFRGWRAIY